MPGSSTGKESACNAGGAVQFLGREDPQRRYRLPTLVFLGFPGGSDGKESTYNVRDLGLIPGLGRSPEGMAIHASILAWRIPIDRGAWQVTVHEVAELDMTE